MTRGLGEALIGYRVDPQAGPVILVAAGGINTEIYKDRALRLAPVTLDEAREMIAEVKGFAPLRGFRGSKPGDLEALADAIVKISRIGELDPRVMELEVNPVLVRPQGQGIVAVDALARLAARS
jgi:acyl-CoA synthetase (NDP forming)